MGASLDPEGTSRAALTPLRVLLVEDDDDSREAYLFLLVIRGARVTTADSVRSALDVLGREPFDVLVSDLGLPDGDGCGLIAQVRARHAAGGDALPAICLSGYGEQHRERAIGAGFDFFAVKPILAAELTCMILLLADRLDAAAALVEELPDQESTRRGLLAELARRLDGQRTSEAEHRDTRQQATRPRRRAMTWREGEH